MKALKYIDIHIHQGRDSQIPTAHGASNLQALLDVLHGAFVEFPGTFALAFPDVQVGEFRHPGRRVRIFAEDAESLCGLRTLVDHSDSLDFRVKVKGDVQEVPADFAGPWVEYRRFRIPGKTSRRPEFRAARIEKADTLPYIGVHSRSTDQYFVVYIDPIPTNGRLDGVPGGYGLSVSSRAVSVPDLP
ncbi:type I-F CRISPR-associated endoribonuclease Cas6/Csy4 [Acidithiobacillus ferrooxidans]|uniref:type I-F CRISPR-associated endoribonuclease Cas6/Csy4 n=1 Tax=Acidithiobacillus TaxID=119977 RepID=UPI000300452E|nr:MULTISPECIES: type I-F CRISPR-associated endoribonuclease Cas6/Csy4 [Acidithiobacillus]MBN6744206.1 type I-F CRISPR-associated endoribonuclease Cas6/Csy4 [Acidithiobacillus sp. MC2.2]MBN6746917.1 type I-F CRISPR-associated endoribonuclease Cas6/Csy4 [Acidithiobacillus sp. PG05]